MIPIIILVIIGITVLFIIVTYNGLVRNKNLVSEAWSGIDVQLKRRYDLVPNLVDTVKGYMQHERELLQKITEYRTKGVDADTVKQHEQADVELSKSLRQLFVVVENYPDLKANQNFLKLQNQLSTIEDDLQMARRYYNGTVRDNNILIESFPSNMVAGIFNFPKADYFEIDFEERAVPKVDLNTDDE